MTVFEAVAPQQPVFAQVLDALYGGERDALTQSLIAAEATR